MASTALMTSTPLTSHSSGRFSNSDVSNRFEAEGTDALEWSKDDVIVFLVFIAFICSLMVIIIAVMFCVLQRRFRYICCVWYLPVCFFFQFFQALFKLSDHLNRNCRGPVTSDESRAGDTLLPEERTPVENCEKKECVSQMCEAVAVAKVSPMIVAWN